MQVTIKDDQVVELVKLGEKARSHAAMIATCGGMREAKILGLRIRIETHRATIILGNQSVGEQVMSDMLKGQSPETVDVWGGSYTARFEPEFAAEFQSRIAKIEEEIARLKAGGTAE